MLIFPPMRNTVKYFKEWHLSPSDYGAFPPLGLLYISTFLKKNMPDADITVIDCLAQNISYSELEERIITFNPDVVGISAFSVCLIDVLKVARLAKSINKNTHICIGGPHLFIYPKQTLQFPEVDSIVIGEGEYVFFELIKQIREGNLTGGVDGLYLKSDLKNKDFKKAKMVDIDNLPFFDIDFVERKFYYSAVGRHRNVITLLSSRGCPYSCTFCDVPYKVYRGRKIESILEEIKLRLNQGFKEIFFYDDTFNVNPQRVIDLSLQIIKHNLKFEWSFRGRVNSVTFEMLKIAKEAGCTRIHFGIETSTDEGLRQLKKGITIEQIEKVLAWCCQLKITTIADFIIGLPFEQSREDIIGNINRLIKFGPDFGMFNVLQPIPGSEIYESGIKRGIIDPKKWEDFVRSPYIDFKPPLWTEYLPEDELVALYYFAYRKFYIRPRCILNKLCSLATITELRRTLRGGAKILFKY